MAYEIYVPKIKLYIAKETSLYGLDWRSAHKELHKKGLQMLTIREFIDFILYLKQNPNIQDTKKILDEILTQRDPCRTEWLDAKFSEKDKQMYINYNHRTVNGKLVAQNKEPLEECLMTFVPMRKIDLASCNKQGLPTKEGDDIYFWCPIEGRVAGFSASPFKTILHCDWYAGGHPSIGVRAARKRYPPF